MQIIFAKDDYMLSLILSGLDIESCAQLSGSSGTVWSIWCCEDVGSGIHFLSPALLQLTVLRHIWQIDDLVAVCSECCCASSVGCPAVRPHLTSATPVALASGFGSRCWVEFKISTLVYHSLSGMAPLYLATDCQLVSNEARPWLRLASSRTCVIRQTYSQFGDRCFAAACPNLWNSLPVQLRQSHVSYE